MKVSKAMKIAMLIFFLSRDDIAEIILLKKKMSDEFEIKDLGNLKYCICELVFAECINERHFDAWNIILSCVSNILNSCSIQ